MAGSVAPPSTSLTGIAVATPADLVAAVITTEDSLIWRATLILRLPVSYSISERSVSSRMVANCLTSSLLISFSESAESFSHLVISADRFSTVSPLLLLLVHNHGHQTHRLYRLRLGICMSGAGILRVCKCSKDALQSQEFQQPVRRP